MKSGVSLQQMLTEVKRQSESKEDYLIAPNRLRMESYGKEMFLHLSDDSGTELIEPMTITGIAHRQIGTHLRIPAAYYDRMREERPDLLAYNANTWFKQESSQRMLRTLDGSARAYLSNRYRRIDNIDIACVTLPILGGLPDIRFESCQITESRMYIKAVNLRLQAEVSPGDIVQAGIIISNSEVGLGSVSIQPLIYRLVCSNGMVVNEAAARRNHVGRVTDSEENFSVYSQATLDAEDKAFVMKIQDTVRAAVEEARFAQVVGKMQEAKAAQMDTHDVPAVVKLASKEFHITDSESTGVLQRLIESNDLTLYGLSNAVTRHSQTNPEGKDYSVATFKRLGDFHGDQLASVRKYALSFREQIRGMNRQRIEAKREQDDGLCEVESYTAAPAAADDSFCIGATVNGDTQPLPA